MSLLAVERVLVPRWQHPPDHCADRAGQPCRGQRPVPSLAGLAGTRTTVTGTFHSPGWGVPALEFLVERRAVTAIGHETTDTDPGRSVQAGKLPAETYILSTGRWQIELLTRLAEVPATGALISATAPKPKDGYGFPARAYAVAPREE